MKFTIVALGAMFLLTMAGCSDEGDDPTSPTGGGNTIPIDEVEEVSYVTHIQPIWNGSCIGCHGQGGNGGLDLREDVSRANLVGIDATGYPALRVVAGDPGASVIYGKITDSGQYGGPMPPAGSLLAIEDRELVRRWIADGAPDN